MRPTLLWLLSGILLFRLTAVILSFFYGPWVYLAVMVGGLYLALDLITLYVVFKTSDDEPVTATERQAKIAWIGLNAVAVLALIVVIGFLLDLGFWSMTYEPVHLVLFVVVCCLVILLLAGLLMFYLSLKRKHQPMHNNYRGF